MPSPVADFGAEEDGHMCTAAKIGLGLNALVLVGAAIRLLDVFVLTARQRERITDGAMALWYWLDDQRAGRLLRVLWNPRVQSVILWAYTGPIALVVPMVPLVIVLGWSEEGIWPKVLPICGGIILVSALCYIDGTAQ